MNKLIITFVLFALMIWVWSSYFRAIPHLQQVGVLKNFQLKHLDDFSGEYVLLKKRYYSPARRSLHPASPVVGSFNDLAYVSNIDLLLGTGQLSHTLNLKQVEFEQQQRCYHFKLKSTARLSAEDIYADSLNVSVIANSARVADQLRQLRTGQSVYFTGNWVEVNSLPAQHFFSVGQKIPAHRQNCAILRVHSLSILK
ncbi:hypothetical protein B9T24_04390 [Acinetobacter sp. ANC 4654]|uniref:hypothetical protein n=1 Tax=Acinetobacter sp. ANC 4654 TaxID=1977872 RepID=UPI000A346E4C|nr:hypothetical protein [Acinetobacter sp. ANC 4654]OTG97363.1 hypothetical protein B9T24_04390 [Acinetobacter sp. ANC 4654]